MDDYLELFDPFAPASWEEEEADAWESPAEETEEAAPPEKEETKVKQEAKREAQGKEEEMPEKFHHEIEVAAHYGYGQFTQAQRGAAVASFEARQQREREEAAEAYRAKYAAALTTDLKGAKDGQQAEHLIAQREEDFQEFMAGVNEELQEERVRFQRELGGRF